MAMTERDRKVLAVVLGILVLAGCWFLMIKPKRSAVAEAQTQKDQAQAALDQAKQSEAEAKSIKFEKPQSYAKIVRLGAAVPADPDFESLLVQLSSVAEKSGVSFQNLAVSTSTDSSGVTAAAGGTTCGTDGSAAATGSTGGTGATASGSTAETWVGSSRDKATDAATATNNAQQASSAADAALSCDAAPTLADLSAQAAGLTSYQYTLSFEGSFFKLENVLGRILDMVRVRNGDVAVHGRLLDIKQMSYSVSEFPMLSASVQLTGYSMPVGGVVTDSAATTTGTPASATASTGAN